MNSSKKKTSNRTACIHVNMFDYILYQHYYEPWRLSPNFWNSSLTGPAFTVENMLKIMREKRDDYRYFSSIEVKFSFPAQICSIQRADIITRGERHYNVNRLCWVSQILWIIWNKRKQTLTRSRMVPSVHKQTTCISHLEI